MRLLQGQTRRAGGNLAGRFNQYKPAMRRTGSALRDNLFAGYYALKSPAENAFDLRGIQKTPGYQFQRYGKPMTPPRPPKAPSMYR